MTGTKMARGRAARVGDAGVIKLRGVRQNNLKNLSLDIPKGRLVVVTGPSGSGKSSLAFDTLYAEGQRRYVETFSPYTRQFLDRMDRPQVDWVEGIPPAIAIQQRNTVRTTRSTVGTMTEICDYMKVIWSAITQVYCYGCGQLVQPHSPEFVWDWVRNQVRDSSRDPKEVVIAFEVPLSSKLSIKESLRLVEQQGYQRVWVNGRVVRVTEAHEAIDKRASTLAVVQDRVRITPENRARFIESCEQAFQFGKGRLLLLERAESGEPGTEKWVVWNVFTAGMNCPVCDISFDPPSPGLFSFNHPLGACPKCNGFGRIITIDYKLAVPDWSLSLAEGAVKPWRSGFSAECQKDLLRFCKARGVPVDVPFKDLTPEQRKWVLEGDPDYGIDDSHQWPYAWYGVKGYFKWLESRAYKMHVRVLLSRYRAYVRCPECGGTRFKKDALAYKLNLRELFGEEPGWPPLLDLAGFYALPIRDAFRVIDRVRAGFGPKLGTNSQLALAIETVHKRLNYLVDIGLGYLTLDRPTRTLSGGEIARVNLTACLGARLVNTLFVLDEPSIGLHPHDTIRLIRVLKQLRDLGNTVVVVEHDPDIIATADHVIDLGPGRGEHGGELVFQGSYSQLLQCSRSLTGQYLSGRIKIQIPRRREVPESYLFPAPSNKGCAMVDTAFPVLTLEGARKYNLKNLTVHFPLGRFVCVTGVSGSGKSTLIREVLYPALILKLGGVIDEVLSGGRDVDSESEVYEREIDSEEVVIRGAERLSKVIMVDQGIITRTPRSNPALYIGAFDYVRQVFARHPEARMRGLTAAAFSFNSAEGQCDRCRGAGYEKIEMQFLSDVYVQCAACGGRRYKPHVLEVQISPPGRDNHRWNIDDFLQATVEEAIEFLQLFESDPDAQRATRLFQVLKSVGLGYLRLGQPVSVLSTGECQRLKLARFLADWGMSEKTGRILFLFDEPTVGLHLDDINILLPVLQQLVDQGHTVVVVEHNLEVIKCADWVIDLGPGAGDEGGQLVAAGPPEFIAQCEKSLTGQALRRVL